MKRFLSFVSSCFMYFALLFSLFVTAVSFTGSHTDDKPKFHLILIRLPNDT